MGDTATNTENAPKKSFFKGVKSEFKKIIWPDKQTLAKQSAAVVAISVALGVVIAILDLGIQYGIEQILKIG
ncbi:preprotein translocase subunit SecE [Anaerosporobacter faecicola]|uniref:preprotein translocase subunit SecE n=1 Tax=Anaerosporobacter faecicola TaxID=2718714 RepID=UPI001438E59F|nr:preprotein translocase subunit SecE [Anaerosporobacter faecicola]